MSRNSTFALLFASLTLTAAALGGDTSGVKHLLFFSKASSWEQKIVHRDGDQLSFLEMAVQKLGQENGIEFTFRKDGDFFSAENLAPFDAFFFFTSGDLTFQERTGRGDNFPLMTLEGKKAFLDAIRNGKGFVGCNTAVYTFIEPTSPGEERNTENAGRYTRMIGGGYIGHNEVQKGHFSYLDRSFPGMEKVPAGYAPVDQWYAFRNQMPDLHVIMALDSAKLTGNLYERPNYPVAWARLEGKGRVFYTTMGHTAEIWQDPVFLQMLLGGIRWATRAVDANVAPDVATVTPQANEIPAAASKFVPSHPPMVDPHFPNFKVWLDKEYRVEGTKRVLVYTKSSGYEHPLVYRDTAWPSPLESELLDFGQENHVDFVFTKDGAMFTPENLAGYDAILCYTSGDPARQPRNGLGDNYPLMPLSGKQALLEAIREGKGFVGIHSTIQMSGVSRDAGSSDVEPYAAMLGARWASEGTPQRGTVTVVDGSFPGLEAVPTGFAPVEDWYAFDHLRPDLHVLLTLNSGKIKGDPARRQNPPVAWARMEGKGRVYYTGLGHSEETWKSPVFRQMLLGAIRWATHSASADITPNVSTMMGHPDVSGGKAKPSSQN